MTEAKLFILGQEIELLWTEIQYHREVRINGKPSTEVLGGLITLCFSQMTHNNYVTTIVFILIIVASYLLFNK